MSAPAATPSRDHGLQVRVVLRVVLVVVTVVLTLYLMYLLRRPLTWIFIAGFIAIALSGPVNFLSNYMRRGLAVATVYVLLVLTPFALMGLLVPPIVTEANNLVQNLPEYADQVTEFVNENDNLRQLQEEYDITGRLQEEAEKLPARLGDAAGVLSDIGVGLVNSIFAGVTILVLSIFMLSSGRHFIDGWIREYQPEREEWWHRLFARISNAIGNYVAGALLQATVAGVTSYVMLTILGVDFALPLAVVVFLLDLIPLVGATIGAVVVGIVTVFSDFPVDTVIWAVFAVIYQQVENNIIQPRIQARAVQVDPLVVLVSVLFGSALMGVLGALLAIPVAAAIQITYREYRSLRRQVVPPVAKPGPAPSSAGP
jgi:predicted PurR-regulated permease PerM